MTGDLLWLIGFGTGVCYTICVYVVGDWLVDRKGYHNAVSRRLGILP